MASRNWSDVTAVTDPPPTTGELLADLVQAGEARDDLEAVTRPLLKALGDAIGLESTYLTRIDWDEDVQRIVYARNVGAMEIPEGLSVPWSDTLCKRALESGQVCTADVPGVWGDSDAARDLGIQTYVSAPVTLPDGSIVGTLCGASALPVAVDDRTAALLRLFSRLVADQMERERVARAATQRADEAERSLRDRVQFAAESTHALKGPLAVVHGWLSMIELGNDRAAILDEGLGAMRRGIEQLRARIDRLLEESHATTVGQQLTIRPVDVEEVVAELAGDLRSPGHPIVTELTPARALADSNALTIVLEHLVENAVKYSPDGGTITLGVRTPDDGRVCVSVRDEGVGVPEGVDVFEPFSRASDGHEEGVGLGLHIVRSLVLAMGGEVTARRNDGGPGSTFEVMLPTAG